MNNIEKYPFKELVEKFKSAETDEERTQIAEEMNTLMEEYKNKHPEEFDQLMGRAQSMMGKMGGLGKFFGRK